mgnify:CR=1 FL=1
MPIFASIELAARLERAECDLLADGIEAMARLATLNNPMIRPIAGGLAVFARDGSPFNKLAGLGFGGPPPENELAEIECAFASRAADLNIELSTLADPAIAPMLTARGYQLVGFESVLGHALHRLDNPRLPPDITITKIADDQLSSWVDTVVSGFMTPDTQGVASHEKLPREAIEPAIRDFASSRGFIAYLAAHGADLAAGAGLRIHGGIAQFCGSSTLPPHRRNGIQSALLAHRLNDAAKAGCDLAVVVTQPGSKSMQNIQRRGFELLYNRAILQKPASE